MDMTEFWCHILECLGGESCVLLSFKEAVLSSVNHRLQFLLQQNNSLFRNKFPRIIVGGTKVIETFGTFGILLLRLRSPLLVHTLFMVG